VLTNQHFVRSIIYDWHLFLKTEIGQFQKIVGGLIELVDELAKEAETEKMKVHSYNIQITCSADLLCSFI